MGSISSTARTWPFRSACPVPRVATIHDLTFYRIPRRYSRLHRWYYRALARLATRAEQVIVPSQAVANDVVRYLAIRPRRPTWCTKHPGQGSTAPRTRKSLRCARGWASNRPTCSALVWATPESAQSMRCARSRGFWRRHPCTLVLAGHAGRLRPALKREAQLRGLGDAVRSIGYVSDDDLPALFSGATALIYPSLYEGFGLPPLEAMACGTPVIATGAPAMSEVLADAAMFVPRRDPAAIASAAATLLELRARGGSGQRRARSTRRVSVGDGRSRNPRRLP